MNIKPCKICGGKRYANQNVCFKCFKDREKKNKEEKAKRKLERKQGTKKYQKEIVDKLIKKCDKLYQEIGRKMYSLYPDYSCLHHIVRKSKSLNLRYDFDNGMPVSLKEHCLIHSAQDCEIECQYILAKGEEWFNNLMLKRRVIITDRLTFMNNTYERLKKILETYN